MEASGKLVCPVCKGSNFSAKYEATYVYTYIIDSDAPGLNNKTQLLPYMYDSREQKESKQYIECNTCGAQYPCYYDEGSKSIDFSRMQNALLSGRNV